VIFLPLTVQVTFSTFVTPVQFMAELFVGGVSSEGSTKLTLSPLAIVKLL